MLDELEGKHYIIALLQCSVYIPECIKPPAAVFVCLLLFLKTVKWLIHFFLLTHHRVNKIGGSVMLQFEVTQ